MRGGLAARAVLLAPCRHSGAAQRLAGALGGILPTRKMVNAISRAVFVAMCRRRIQICEYAAGRRNITVVAETVFAKAGLALRVFQSAEFRNSSHTFSRAAMS